MAVYMSEEEQRQYNEDREEFIRQREEEIETERINKKQKRIEGDRKFRRVTGIVLAVIFVILVIRWAM